MSVAGYFLRKAGEEGIDVTPLKLMKIVYIAHGWHLALTGRPLIDEQVRAWQYGPVIPSLYGTFRVFGKGPIRIKVSNMEEFPRGSEHEFEPKTLTVLDSVWDALKGHDELTLSAMAHEHGTPWQEAWNSGAKGSEATIPNERIKEHYCAKVQ